MNGPCRAGELYGHDVSQALRPGLAEPALRAGCVGDGFDVWAMDSMCGRWRCVGDGDVWAMDSRSRVDNDRKSAHERSIQIVRDAMVSTSWVGGGEPDPGLIGAFAAQRAASVSPDPTFGDMATAA